MSLIISPALDFPQMEKEPKLPSWPYTRTQYTLPVVRLPGDTFSVAEGKVPLLHPKVKFDEEPEPKKVISITSRMGLKFPIGLTIMESPIPDAVKTNHTSLDSPGLEQDCHEEEKLGVLPSFE